MDGFRVIKLKEGATVDGHPFPLTLAPEDREAVATQLREAHTARGGQGLGWAARRRANGRCI